MAEANTATGQLDTEYVNIILFRLLEVLYDSKGKGAKFRTCILGKEDLLGMMEARGHGFVTDDVEKCQAACLAFLRELGIVEDLHCRIEGEIAEVEIKGYIHHPVDQMLMDNGVEPYACIPANLMCLALEKGLGQETEIVKQTYSGSTCKVKILLFPAESSD